MKTELMLAMLILPLMGCSALKKITDGPTSTPGPSPLPADFTLRGTTVANDQIVQVRCLNSAVTVRVKRLGEDWHTCNQYEVKIDTSGSGGGAVWFRNICYPTFNSNGKLLYLVITHNPVAPTGTEYEIRSILNH